MVRVIRRNKNAWRTAYRMMADGRRQLRRDKSRRVEAKVFSPPICPCCGQPCNIRDYSSEVWYAAKP